MKVDSHLDSEVADQYKEQPLAQDWARIAKVQEEAGEAVSEFILATGQNPRKGEHPEAMTKVLEELADVTVCAVLAIQHFTKDITQTQEILLACQRKAMRRVSEHDGRTNVRN